MWFIDILHDEAWLGRNHGVLPQPSYEIIQRFESAPNFECKLLMYSDAGGPRHFRVLLTNTHTLQDCQYFIANRLNKVIASLEAALSLEAEIGFEIWKPFGSSHVLLTSGECTDGEIPTVSRVHPSTNRTRPFDAELFKQIHTSIQIPGVEEYLFHLQRAMNYRNEIDLRWTHYYRIFERKFNSGGGVHLARLPEWRAYLESIRNELGAFLSGIAPERTLYGYLEELRVLAEHANTSSPFGLDPRLESSLPLVRFIAVDLINSLLPGRPLRFLE